MNGPVGHRYWKRLLVGVLILLSPFSAGAETLRLGGMIRCPWVCTDAEGMPGVLVEIATSVFEPEGVEIEFQSLPWSRALRYVRAGNIDAITGVLRRNAPELVFPGRPQAVSQFVFVVPDSESWRHVGLVSLWQVRIGVTQDVSYGSMDSYIRRYRDSDRIQALSGETAIIQNLRALQSQRIDVLLEDRSVLNYHLKGAAEYHLKEVGVLPAENLYIAFDPEHPDSESRAGLLSKKMKSLQESGELEQIYRKYGIAVGPP